MSGEDFDPGWHPHRRVNTTWSAIGSALWHLATHSEDSHVAFGVGIHRCAGSNLARMEMRVAVEEWLARIPEFRLDPAGEVTWAGGQVRGPRNIPVLFS